MRLWPGSPSLRFAKADSLWMRVYPKLRINAVRGFTLIELMVAVAITVIVAAVALPSFLSQLKSSRRIDAVEA